MRFLQYPLFIQSDNLPCCSCRVLCEPSSTGMLQIDYPELLVSIYVMGVTKMGNTVLRVGPEPKSLAFQANVLPLHNVGSLMSPLYPRPPVCGSLPQRSVQTTTYIYIYTHIYICICYYFCSDVCMCTYAHIHIHMYTYTYMCI